MAGAGGPDVDGAVESDSEDVVAGPVYKVKVEVILELRGIEDLEGYFRDFAHSFE